MYFENIKLFSSKKLHKLGDDDRLVISSFCVSTVLIRLVLKKLFKLSSYKDSY